MAADYDTIEGRAEDSFVEKKSEFIGYIKHVETDEQAVDFVNEIRSMHRKAKHNVYAYILRDGSITRYSDDGEPQGTAGVPVFEVIRKEGLTDVCVVVTRYFGGILLGGGGLVRAYSHAAKLAVDAAERKKMCTCFPVKITADYNLYGKVNNILPGFDVKIVDTEFGSDVTISLLCRSALVDSLIENVTDLCCGNVIIEKDEESFENFA